MAIATLALGIGASTAVFTVVDSVLLRPLRFAEPQRLTMIRWSSGARLSPEYLDEWRRQSQAFQDMAGWHDVRANLTDRREPLEVRVDRATTNFFSMLRTPAFLGRTLTSTTDLSDVKPEVVLSYSFWQRRYGGNPGIIGQPITLDDETLTIVGVMPEGFTIRTNELAETRAQLWTPFRLAPEGDRMWRGGFLNVVARLAPGVTVHRAQAELSLIDRRIKEGDPYRRDWTVEVTPLLDATVKNVRLTLFVLFGAVGVLLLIACANVASLVLSRSAVRQTELAIRLSLGATKGRLVRQFLTESLVLAAVGGALGVLAARWGTALVVAAIPPTIELPRTAEIHMDWKVLAFASIVTILTPIASGLAPAVSSARSADLGLRAATGGSSAGRNRSSVGNALIVSEVGLALVLLAGAGSSRPQLLGAESSAARVPAEARAHDADDACRH